MKDFQYKYIFLTLLLSLHCLQPVLAAEFSLFGDVQYVHSNEEDSFVLGPLDLIADQEISDTAAITADIIFEDDHGGFEMHVERFFLSKSLGDNFDVAAGRFQKPLGFWNQNFHHGSLSQDTVTRPFFLEQEDIEEGVFPAHIVGALVDYHSAISTLQLVVANNSGMNTEAITGPEDKTSLASINSNDPSSNKSIVARATYRPAAGRFELGVLGILNNVVETGAGNDAGQSTTMAARGDTLFKERVYGADISYLGKQFYVFGELYQLNFKDNQNLDSKGIDLYLPSVQTYNAQAYYFQVGYRLTNKITLAARRESLDFNAGSTFFDIQGIVPETRNLIALKYRVEESNAFRIEVRQEKPEGHESDTIYAMQWFFYLL